MSAKKTDNRQIYPVICELIEELAYSAYHLQMPPGGYKPNKKYAGVTKKKFEIAGPQDVADAVISLIFGEAVLLERKKRGPKGFENQDRKLIKWMWGRMDADGLTLEKGLDLIVPMADRRPPGTNPKKKFDPADNDESVRKRLRELQRKLKKEEKKKATQIENNRKAEKLLEDMIAQIKKDGLDRDITEESLIADELDFIRAWLRKYSGS